MTTTIQTNELTINEPEISANFSDLGPSKKALNCIASLPQLTETPPSKIPDLEKALKHTSEISKTRETSLTEALGKLSNIERGARNKLEKEIKENRDTTKVALDNIEDEIAKNKRQEARIKLSNQISSELNELAQTYRPLDWQSFLAWPNAQGLPVFALFNYKGNGESFITLDLRNQSLSCNLRDGELFFSNGRHLFQTFANGDTLHVRPREDQRYILSRNLALARLNFEQNYLSLLKDNINFDQLIKDVKAGTNKIQISTIFEGTIPDTEKEIIQKELDSRKWEAIYLIAEVETWAINQIQEPVMRVDPIIAGLKHNHLFHIGDFDVSTKELDALCLKRPKFN